MDTFTSPVKLPTILIVDDEELLRRTTQRILSANGYPNMAADSGQAAMQLFSLDHPSSIQLAIIDVYLPDMSGFELAHELILRAPNIKVLFTSGFPPDFLEQGSYKYDFIPKPFQLDNLINKIGELLQSPTETY